VTIGHRLPLGLLLSAAVLLAQPAPNSVQNPGSNSLPGLPNYGIAQGSVFVVYGTGGMGPSTILGATTLPLQTSLGGTSITVTVSGTTANALMVYTLATQIAAVLPSNIPAGSGTLTVTYNNQSGSTPITVVPSNFGILSVNETGAGPAVATHVDNSVISGTNAANTGEEIVIWGTGLGPLPAGISDAGAPGAGASNIGTITVWIGGVQANVVYHGRNPSDPGLDQLNVTVPSGVSGCFVSLVVQTGNQVSNTTTLAVAPNGKTCSDANGLSLSSLAPALNANGSARIGFITLLQDTVTIGGLSSSSILGVANFQKYTAYQLSSSASPLLYPSSGSCTVSVSVGSNNPSVTPGITATGLDAGAAITLVDPAGNMDSLVATGTKGSYSLAANTLASLAPATYQFTGPGGTDVGAFTANLKVASALSWTNRGTVAASAIDRTQPLSITWSGGDSGSYVLIGGFGNAPFGTSSTVSAFFLCLAPNSAGGFTVPPYVLESIPANSSKSTDLMLVGSTSPLQTFTAPGLDAGVVTSAFLTGETVTFK